jgi:hypothetical protein
MQSIEALKADRATLEKKQAELTKQLASIADLGQRGERGCWIIEAN